LKLGDDAVAPISDVLAVGDNSALEAVRLAAPSCFKPAPKFGQLDFGGFRGLREVALTALPYSSSL
jgi:hypothetical protein